MQSIDEARTFSDDKLASLRQAILTLVPTNEMVVINGSFARREASGSSDLDFYIVRQENDASTPVWAEKIRAAMEKIVPVSAAEDGAFAHVEFKAGLLQNIGGEADSNHNITRRMLLLLEGEWLFNEKGLKEVRRKILERYIGEGITNHQLALFLLNDVIRYYRTMAVDYEFKTVETAKIKPWGIRNIKLIFSRKLLYASGLFSVALTSDRTRAKKISELERLFEMPVIDRIIDICGKSNSRSALESYSLFLEKLTDDQIRKHLEKLEKDDRDDQIFRELKNEGHHFTRELLKLFENTFDSTHPIRRAIIF